MDDFNTIRLKKKTIEKFKKYSKEISPSYSETLEYMISFFKDNDLSPYDTLNANYTSFINVFNKRMDALISILRNIEKTQLIPTREMLESLFIEENEEEPIFVEQTMEEIEASKSEEEKLLDYYYKQCEVTNKELFETKEKLQRILDKLVYIKSAFGANYYRLNIPDNEVEKLKT
nr:hypothetical protein [uncultured bacterium]